MIGYDDFSTSPAFERLLTRLVAESDEAGVSAATLQTLTRIPAFQVSTQHYANGQMTKAAYWALVKGVYPLMACTERYGISV